MTYPRFKSQGAYTDRANIGTVSPTIPAGYAVGDVLILVVESTISVATPSGWTLIANPKSAEYYYTYVYSMVVTGAVTSPTIYCSANAQALSAQIFCFTEVNATPINAVSQTTVYGYNMVKGSTSRTVTVPSITTTANECLIVIINRNYDWGDGGNNLATSFTNAALTELAKIWEVPTYTGYGEGQFTLATGKLSKAGATGTTDIVIPSYYSQGVGSEAVIFALAPAISNNPLFGRFP